MPHLPVSGDAAHVRATAVYGDTTAAAVAAQAPRPPNKPAAGPAQ